MLYKKPKCKLHNTKYVTMATVLFHNICIYKNDPGKPHWRLDVEHLELVNHDTLQLESRDSKRQSMWTYRKISEWLWNKHWLTIVHTAKRLMFSLVRGNQFYWGQFFIMHSFSFLRRALTIYFSIPRFFRLNLSKLESLQVFAHLHKKCPKC